jgi:hypothetical protein
MLIEITPIDIFKTLSANRSNKNISRTFGISYSQLTSWISSAEASSKTGETGYVTYILLEYFRRYDHAENEKVMEKYGLQPTVDDLFLETYLFTPESLGTYISSSVLWKSDLIDSFHQMNDVLFKEQLFYLEHLARCSYPHMPEKEISDEKEIIEELIFSPPSYL